MKKLLIFPIFLFIFFTFVYSLIIKTIPISYWDEVLWADRSYFFDFYIRGDFNKNIWKSKESYDQPKLAEYAYGAWLYPLFLKQKLQNQNLSYTQFLLVNGISDKRNKYLVESLKNCTGCNNARLNEWDTGFPNELITKYNASISNPVNLIYYARILNIFLLSGSVVCAYFFIKKFAGKHVAVIFSILYGFNPLIIDSSLKVQSEALFLFTFNLSLLFANLYFTKVNKNLYLMLFSISSALCISTKLNGVMLILLFLVLSIFNFFIAKKEKVIFLIRGFQAILISLIIFISLNPFTFDSPLKNIQYMFHSRIIESSQQAKYHSNNYLSNNFSRLTKILENYYFSQKSNYFNAVMPLEKQTMPAIYGLFLFIFFIIGFLHSAKYAFYGSKEKIFFLCFFVWTIILTTTYLMLDWWRYYIHMSLFFVALQTLGFYLILKKLINIFFNS